jgi:hypothetical protein
MLRDNQKNCNGVLKIGDFSRGCIKNKPLNINGHTDFYKPIYFSKDCRSLYAFVISEK